MSSCKFFGLLFSWHAWRRFSNLIFVCCQRGSLCHRKSFELSTFLSWKSLKLSTWLLPATPSLSSICSVGYPSQRWLTLQICCCRRLAESKQKGSSYRLLCHMHSGSVSCHRKQCSVWPALLPASASTWNIIHQDISFYNVMPLWLTCLAWESHPHAWRWRAQPASSSKFQRWQAIPNSQLLPGFNWEACCLICSLRIVFWLWRWLCSVVCYVFFSEWFLGRQQSFFNAVWVKSLRLGSFCCLCFSSWGSTWLQHMKS